MGSFRPALRRGSQGKNCSLPCPRSPKPRTKNRIESSCLTLAEKLTQRPHGAVGGMEDWAPDPGPAFPEVLLLQLWAGMVLEGKSGNLEGNTAGDSPGRIKPNSKHCQLPIPSLVTYRTPQWKGQCCDCVLCLGHLPFVFNHQ